ncbi:General transcription factor 3C polypeptide 5 [Auxenochlorella protothecoides]|uniref:General transcription factor 3C polypeptide 5 n=1 Tax=Auxenochlorella protothecoides TaxID=3075 RepID=A0A087SP52_AUXPR|nr:General transcription factor 3C polypeptide 5 [Auxenochlorella protothecoides]KFM27506.1 General transcription factor 3C polypeptide 5 [Auxenochlorella protothecoides]
MQYVQSDTRPCEAASLPSDAIPGALPPGFDREPLCTLPPAFLRGPVYEFYHTAAASLQVPEALRPALAQLSLLLDAKPVWTPASLMEKIAPLPASDAAALLPHLCYKFRSGPWKGAWVRRAYDPRAHPEARRLQTLAYELPEAWWQRLVEVKAVQKAQAAEEAPAGPAGAGNAGQEPRPLPLITPPPPATWAQLHSFQALPSQRTTLFQVGEIDDGEVQALLNDASNFSESLCEAAGWYTPSSWSAVKAAVAAQFGKLIDSGFNGHFRWTTS